MLHALAWGSGPFLRLNRQRIRALGTLWNERGRPGIGALRHSLRLAAEDPMAAYASMCPGGAARLMHLGPAFFTKVLYFAGAGATDHPSPILDRNVATALNKRCGWASLGTSSRYPRAGFGATTARPCGTGVRAVAFRQSAGALASPPFRHRSPPLRST